MKDNKGFIFYKSYANAAKSLPVKEQLRLLWAIIDKGLEDKEPSLPEGSISAGMYALIAPNLEANRLRYQKAQTNAENGKRGGRPKKEEEGSFDTDDFFMTSVAAVIDDSKEVF